MHVIAQCNYIFSVVTIPKYGYIRAQNKYLKLVSHLLERGIVLSMAPHSLKCTIFFPTILDFVHSYTESGKKIWPASDNLLF